jgi:hypothetical protein
MYPECRHVLPSGSACNSPALSTNHFCYFHARLNQRQAARHSYRAANGRFAALSSPQDSVQNTETVDYGPYPVGASAVSTLRETPLDLPPVEDTESIQLALIDVLQAIAANQIDSKRAGLLLYGLQVASANVKNLRLPIDAVRTITHTEDGAALAPQDYGLDNEDYDELDEEEDEEDEEEYEPQ